MKNVITLSDKSHNSSPSQRFNDSPVVKTKAELGPKTAKADNLADSLLELRDLIIPPPNPLPVIKSEVAECSSPFKHLIPASAASGE